MRAVSRPAVGSKLARSTASDRRENEKQACSARNSIRPRAYAAGCRRPRVPRLGLTALPPNPTAGGEAQKGMSAMAQRVVAITGASGFVGRWLVHELLGTREGTSQPSGGGWKVRALVRSREKANRMLPIEAPGLSLVDGDIWSKPALDELLDGADACINLAGLLREGGGEDRGQTFERVHVEGTRSLLAAVDRAKVKRYVQMSAMGADPDGTTAYWRTKGKAERLVRQSGLDWTIFRPGLIHGPDGEFMNQVASWVRGRAMPFVMVPYFARIKGVSPTGEGFAEIPPALESPEIEPVFVGDVVRAMARSLDAAESIHEIYPLFGSERLSWPELMEFASEHVPNAKKLPIVPIPGVVAMLKAQGASLVGLGDLMPFDAGMAVMGQHDVVGSNAKACTQLGMDFAPFRETMAQYADVM